MKKLQRFILGLVTSLLLSVGLIRAAEVTTPTVSNVESTKHLMPHDNCSTICSFL